ncbi:hypothetical protein ACFY12_24240 [Streptomyces sp. NPDC001339]|uniref:hypothetical protein n=1 Tax=Streptomyces sp. NPDC001339 TaxID=3364563 RepID=UPI00367AE4C1
MAEPLGTCLAVIGMAISGVVMWRRRRPTGKGLGAPRRAQDARVTRGVALIMLILAQPRRRDEGFADEDKGTGGHPSTDRPRCVVADLDNN